MNNKLFVRNISWDATEDDLRAFFSAVGNVVEAKLVMDRERNRHKGFGFVTFETAEEAERALEELNDKDLNGRPIKIDFAKPQAPRN